MRGLKITEPGYDAGDSSGPKCSKVNTMGELAEETNTGFEHAMWKIGGEIKDHIPVRDKDFGRGARSWLWRSPWAA